MASNEKNLNNQVIALAGIAQAATLVDRLARTGNNDVAAFGTLVHALLETDPKSAESVFINRQHLRMGMETLHHVLQQGQASDPGKNYGEILRYMLSMVHLEAKLHGRKEMLKKIGSRMEHVKKQVQHFGNLDTADQIHGNLMDSGLVHENVVASIASIYVDTVSTFRFRIQVNGNPTYLQQEQVVNKIRTLLLCGIRSAVLWRQMGGSRFKILFNRKQHAKIATELLRIH